MPVSAPADLPWPLRPGTGGGAAQAAPREHGGGGAAAWAREAWWFDAVAEDGALAVAVCVGRRPATGRGWYWAVVAGAGRTTVSVVDPDLALPASGPPLELRAPGLWADHNPSAPGGHWSVAAEAFGVALTDPWEVWDRGFGDPTPVGFDLEWDPVTQPVVVDGDLSGPAGSWAVGCEVHGEVLVGAERLTLTCGGSRGRWWGDGGWRQPGVFETSGWSPAGWSFRRGTSAPDGEGPAAGEALAWAPVLDGAGEEGDPVRLGMAVTGRGGELDRWRGWVRWRPREEPAGAG